jgi:hypothetical protein
MQTSPSLSPPASQRSELLSSNFRCGDEPLASEPTLHAEVDLKEGLTKEVNLMPKNFIGTWMGLMALEHAIEMKLEELAFQLPHPAGREEQGRGLHQHRRGSGRRQTHQACHSWEEAGTENWVGEDALPPESTSQQGQRQAPSTPEQQTTPTNSPSSRHPQEKELPQLTVV